MKQSSETPWLDLVHHFGKDFLERATVHDRDDTFVHQNYADLKKHHFFSALIPPKLGGGGVSHALMCDILRTMAQYCGSTALALSMHQHLLAVNIWKYKNGQGGEDMLKKMAEKQMVLVSTGARDWLDSNGTVQRTAGGYLVTAQKHFASQSAIGDVLVTSAPYHDAEQGWQVLHFPIPFKSEGVTIMNDWYTLGMRGTGSHTVRLENVFVAEAAIVLRRPKGAFHPFWNVILAVAMPLIMSVYVGIAERSAKMAIANALASKTKKPHLPYALAEMNNELTTAQLNLRDMIRITNNFDFQPIDQNGHDILTRKTNVANAAINVVTKAMEVVGGQGFYRSFGLERLFRDVQAAKYHPLQEKDQLLFSGEFMLRESTSA